MAVGGMRRSAHNVGISVQRTICLTYVASGVLVALAGFLFAARLGGASNDTGAGLEIMALTAAVLGGNRLGGGSGSAAKAVLGVVIVMIIVNGLVQLGSSAPHPVVNPRRHPAARGRHRCAMAQEPL